MEGKKGRGTQGMKLNKKGPSESHAVRAPPSGSPPVAEAGAQWPFTSAAASSLGLLLGPLP